MTDKITALAKLDLLNYGKIRKDEAKQLGVAVTFLDHAVKEQRNADKKADDVPTSWAVEAAMEPVDGAKLLDAPKAIFEKYMVLPPHTAETAALWFMHTWTIDAADISPIFALISPEPRCGKTTMLKLLNRLARRAEIASNISTAALFR
jgi:putative DNA primase/helicase